jgi:hypothetical protein
MTSSKVYSGVTYSSPAVGSTNFALTSDAGNAIEYLSQDHIKVESSADGTVWTTLVITTDYTFNSNGTEIVLVVPTVEDQQIRINRYTPLSAQYVTFSDGSLLTSNQLNKAERFSLFCDQEIVDGNVGFDPSDIGLDSTDDLPEGSVNLYYTDARVEAWVDANLADTDALAEGSTNLYYTDERVQGLLDAGGYKPGGGDGGGIPEAPSDGKQYGRQSEGWTEIVSGASGVTKLIAGTNVTISPTSGVGEVTINSTGGGSGPGGDPEWVLDGNNLEPKADTTNVVIGDGEITLSADGSASFTGSVNVNRADGSTSDGFSVEAGTKKRFGVDASGSLKLSDDIRNDVTVGVELKANGSASFTGGTNFIQPSGNQQWGGAAASGVKGFLVSVNGTSYACPSAGSEAYLAYNEGSEIPTVTIKGDGTGTFAGTVKSGDSTFAALNRGYIVNQNSAADGNSIFIRCRKSAGDHQFEVLGDGTTHIGGSITGDPATTEPNIKLSSNGSATFAGTVKVEGDSTPVGKYSAISKYGSLLIGTASDIVSDARLSVDAGNGNLISSGSATFAGKVNATGYRIDQLQTLP